jgi:two-component system sensor histidine kinase CreC
MRIGLRILLGYFLIVGLAGWFLLNVFMAEVKPGVRATLEDTLVDTANLLAVMVADDVRAGAYDAAPMLARMRDYAGRGVSAQISGLPKNKLDYRIYITDAQGIVRFDSENKAVGKDYSRWNDVYLTLRGKYGARSTRDREDDENSTVMHVAAPIRDGERLIGVLTVAKPNASVQGFVERSQQHILRRGALLLALSLLIGLASTYWLARALRKLMHYVEEVQAGRKVALPVLGNTEIGTLGHALEAMRVKLEGKEYVETLMHTLTHELKSPIAAIQASAELLQEDMPPEQRRQFLSSILSQNARQRQLIDKLLALVRVEKQQRLDALERIDSGALLHEVARDFAAPLAARGLRLDLALPQDGAPVLHGDALLLRQAIGNLLDNAIAFAPAGGVVALGARVLGDGVEIFVADGGPGIPDYAAGRVFERFYSLPRPGGGAKSTGLGLPFVREVAALHGGSVSVANIAGPGQGGCRAALYLPLPLAL